MNYISTRSPKTIFDFKQVVELGLPDDGGLFVPESIPLMPDDLIKNLFTLSFEDIAFHIARTFIAQEAIDDAGLKKIISNTFNFPMPLVQVQPDLSFFELFHGPTSAFKDFGARFMSGIISYIREKDQHPVSIITATSGDTGGAVAAAFYNQPDVHIYILFPKGRISEFQENQITGLGGNIRAIEIDGSFDECLDLVKSCFLDNTLKKQLYLTSSNSVNFSRLIPQIIYFFEAYRLALLKSYNQVSFVVPSGNFGNVTSAIYAHRMGLPISQLVAATNANDVFTNYIESGLYEVYPSVKTLSTAMDVGNPSNVERIFHLYRSSWNKIKKDIQSNSIDDKTTLYNIQQFYLKYNYLMDPHTAVGSGNYLLESMMHSENHFIILATGHPYKFLMPVQLALPNVEIPLNPFIEKYINVQKHKVSLEKDINVLKKYLREENSKIHDIL